MRSEHGAWRIETGVATPTNSHRDSAPYGCGNGARPISRTLLQHTKGISMIKHGKIHPFHVNRGVSKSHLEPIKEFVTKGIADAKENILLQPMACDVKGAKRYNGQQCVIAKALTRTLKPQAVAVGRSRAYVVVKGLAIRFNLPPAARKLVEEFDQRGRARNAPVELCQVPASQKLGNPMKRVAATVDRGGEKRKRTKRYGVRAVGGGVAA